MQLLARERRVRRGSYSGKLDEVRIKKLDALGMVWNENADDRLYEMIEAYQKYVKKHKGSHDSRAEADAVRPGLFNWIGTTRHAYRTGNISPKRIEVLNEAGFVWDVYEKYWNEMFVAAEAFFMKNGSLDNPNRQNYEEKIRINAWIRAQRKEYLKPDHGRLDNNKIRKLKSIGVRFKRVEPWMYSYEEYKKYVRQHKTVDIPASYINSDGYNLGVWVAKVRTEYRMGRLSEEKIQLLNNLGIIWEDQNTYNARLYWEKKFAAAKKYYREHGNLKIPCDWITEDGEKLGQWICQVRRIRKGTLKHSVVLDEEKIAALDSIGFIWETR